MNRIRDLRQDKDLKQADLGAIIGTTSATISDYEIEKSEPSKDTWIKLADFFKVPLDYLMRRPQSNINEIINLFLNPIFLLV